MNKLFKAQEELQLRMSRLGKVDARVAIVGIKSACTVGEKYDFINMTRFHLNEEVTELLEALTDSNSRDIHKPWKSGYEALRGAPFESTVDVREEALDMLLFAMNICVAVGVDSSNIDYECSRVHAKVNGRLDNETVI